ncbi:tRNA (cytidine(34)-2'-O)-methyltransferase [Sideroxydans lithotrophicus]|uniref:tRNA (cytidine(34)-2'-O)-methyltransferase n=1 Tax=Sideroxydans lithotrophicus (strain ES-1) TaxID=580332 RepID=D5CND7_SIDLE|nr:tRNA (cytidine(34)-2'-O)-methyltransferase [Sideroxydans lithotrophicus]ADE12834.1 tRNA/rRNA methyltransferase (SpoU) [Sideroxydans lithotrophicus ES-1]
MFNVILYQPEIPPNTGNVIRLCANTGAHLHLIRPLGFDLDDKNLRRAGLDYHEYASVRVYDTLVECLDTLPLATALPHPNPPPGGEGTSVSLRELADTRRAFAFTTKGSHPFNEVRYQPGDAFLFGPESRGLPAEVLAAFVPERRLRLPMLPDNRSLNLSNTVAVTVYEAWRQCGYGGSQSNSLPG